MSGELRTTNLRHKNNTGDPNLTLNADGTTSILVDKAQIVGYQQGYWKPTVNTSDGSNTWLVEGVEPSSTMTSWTASWSRIGNQVTIEWYFTFGVTGNSGSQFQMYNLPYKRSKALGFPGGGGGSAGQGAWNVNANPCYFTGINLGSYAGLTAYMYNNWNDVTNNVSDPNGGVTFQANGQPGTSPVGSTTLKGSNILVAGNIVGNITYTTDDTTWTPINGATIS